VEKPDLSLALALEKITNCQLSSSYEISNHKKSRQILDKTTSRGHKFRKFTKITQRYQTTDIDLLVHK